MPGSVLPVTTAARRARVGVATLFLTNGALFATVVPRYPEIKADLGLSNTAFGSAVAGYGLGALLLGLLSGLLVTRWGSARVATASALLIAANVTLLGVAPTWAALAGAMFLAGSLDSVADVAVNAHGLRVERAYGRSILNSLHGVWSIGAVVGAGLGTAAAGLGVPLLVHLPVVAVLFAALAAGASRLLLPGPDGSDRPAATTRPAEPGGSRATGRRGRAVAVLGGVAVLGTVAATAQVAEDTGATWGAVYLRQELGATAVVGGLAFTALQAAQTVGRLLGDRVVTRFGDRAVARAGAAMAGGAMAVALARPWPPSTVVAFAVVGLGIGTLIPACMRAADGLPGLAPGVGLTLVGSVLRISVLAAPPLVGLVADAWSLRVALLVVPMACALAVLLAGALPADGHARPARTGPGRA